MFPEEKEALREEKSFLVMLHQIYLENPELGFSEEERTEHLLDIMVRISEIDKLLKE